MLVSEILALARDKGITRLDVQLLLAHRLNRPRVWVLAHDDEVIDPVITNQLLADFAQRSAGVPIAYLLGEREFHGLILSVTPDVLVPRPETEVLVDWALALLKAMPGPRTVIDLGTGSGAIALAMKNGCDRAQVLATDNSIAALAVARGNAQRLQLTIEFAAGDWWAAVPVHQRFDLVLSNPPYIAAGDSHLEALAHEPRAALTPGGDGLGALCAVIGSAAAHLRPGGWLIVEHGFDQAPAVQRLMIEQGFGSVSTMQDLAGLPRCTAGSHFAV